MEEKKSIKVSLSTVFLILALIVIVAMAYYIYVEKTNADKEISTLKSNAVEMQNTINELQGKIDSISNTINSNVTDTNNDEDNSTSISVDYTIEMSELESVDHTNNQELSTFFDKYHGKKVKVTGYVSNYGDDAIVPTSSELATYINVGTRETHKERIYAGGYTFNTDVIKQINNLKVGQEITIIGTVVDGTWPLQLENVTIAD